MPARLNIFQRTMLQWNELHPYNAIHVVTVPSPLDLSRLTTVINRYLETLGLTGFSLDRKQGTFHYHGGPCLSEVKVRDGCSDPHGALRDEIETQLNTPFPLQDQINPFRFFVFRGEDSFSLGMVYFHCIAGAEQIVFLLRNIVNMYVGIPVPPLQLDLYQNSYTAFLKLVLKHLFSLFITLPAFIADIRKSFRPRYKDLSDQRIGYSSFSLTAVQLQVLLKMVKTEDVTLNDMFMALLLKSLSPLASGRRSAARRRNIAIASIVNIRKDLKLDLHKTFGPFLGSFIISHPVPEGIGTSELVKSIHMQTLKVKHHKLYLRAPIEMYVAYILYTLLSPDRRKKLYPKYFPLWGGITNINLNALWEQKEGEKSVDYIRAVSTGPVPLVFSITTVRNIINLGVSYRKTVFSSEDIECIIASFVKSINELQAAP